jgi:hypothetical protein
MKKESITPIMMTLLATILIILFRVGVARGRELPVDWSIASGLSTQVREIPYQGRLGAYGGGPARDGVYALRFALYESLEDEAALWSEIHQEVEVRGGNFSLQLGSQTPLPQRALSGERLFLQTAVQGPGEAQFTVLTPAQTLWADQSPAAVEAPVDMACPHDHVGETWTQSAYANGLKISNTGGGTALVAESNTNFWSAIEGNNSGSAIGVYGYSQSGVGVFGDSNTGYAGVFDSGNDSLDVQLRGNVGRINASEYDGSVLYLSSNANIVNKLDNDGGESHYFQIANSSDAVVFYVDENGNVWKNGTISSVVKTPEYGARTTYAVESPQAWIEDFGQATLLEGVAKVSLDPIFAETVDLQAGYHVFLTPVCQQPVILYVITKTITGFSVRGVTLSGVPSGCDFDYRIVAARLGFEKLRLEEVHPEMEVAPR